MRKPSRVLLAAALCLTGTGVPMSAQAYPPGVTAATEASIQRGLAWLARNQAAEGSWRNAGGHGSYPAAMTGLAGMALVASGSTPTRGRYWREVRQSVEFLMRNADSSNGLIAIPAEDARSMYGHGFATLFLAQVYGMEEDLKRQEGLHRVLTRAVQLIAGSQSAAGGWLYTPDSGGDEGSVTVTQLQALRACRNAGITVPITTINRAVGYIVKSANPDGGIRYRAGQGGAARPAITAAAVAVLYNAGHYEDDLAEKCLQFAQRTVSITTDTTRHHFYAHLYLAQALYQRGGGDWDDYYQKMSAWLLGRQSKDGSWDGDGVGTVYGTSIALTILQLPYALAPIYQR